MNALQIVFLVIAAVTLASAGFVAGARRTMHAALWLVLTLMGVAMLLATLQAGFFAVVQILVYVGAIAILILFAVMLTRGLTEEQGAVHHRWWWLAALAAGGLFAVALVILNRWPGFRVMLEELPREAEGMTAWGLALVDPMQYLIPFEVASVLLLAGMVAAIYLAMSRPGGQS
jgi:NADH-quinone oxidoreductase subunit J